MPQLAHPGFLYTANVWSEQAAGC